MTNQNTTYLTARPTAWRGAGFQPAWRAAVAGLLALFSLGLTGSASAAEVIEADVCIYGGTAGGVVAAVQAAR
ncbi:MAG TPA: hypothetical protein PK942_14140, partial [Verrucomicrobiota bacterium]|nr:hypothetical protein [Verrucomicrobiota bacterium]